jgi:hypothetical protein
MKRIIRLTESDLARIVRRVINEQDELLQKLFNQNPIGACKVTKAGNPLFKTPTLNGGPDNILDDMYEATDKKLYTAEGEELPFYGTSGNFAIVKKEAQLGYTLKEHVSCTTGTQKTGNVVAQNESYRRRRYRY